MNCLHNMYVYRLEAASVISREALARVTRNSVLNRAETLAERRGAIWHRTCAYEGGNTVLTANVDGSVDDQDHYEACVVLDESADSVVECTCNCSWSGRFKGACKHCVALALDFNEHAHDYEGFGHVDQVYTSSALSSYIESSVRKPRLRVPRKKPASGSIVLEPTLYCDGDVCLRLRIIGASGSYVITSVSEFADHLARGSYHTYGTCLAFTHTLDMFEPTSAKIASFVLRAVQNRRAFAAERSGGHGRNGGPGSGKVKIGRQMRLTGPEIDELVDFMMGRRVIIDGTSPSGAVVRKRAVTVCQGDPDVGIGFETKDDGAFEIVREGEADFFTSDGLLYAVQDDRLFRCTSRLNDVANFMTNVYGNVASHLMLSRGDAPRFAEAVLPSLERTFKVHVPDELDDLRPDPLELEFRIGHARGGITCDVLAIYGESSYHIARREVGESIESGRDVVGEADARALVGRFFTLGATSSVARIPDDDPDAMARFVFEGMAELRKVGTVITTESYDRLAATATPRITMGLSVRAKLINLTVSAEDLPLNELYALLDSYRQHRRFHRLADGSFVDLSRVDLSEAAELADELGLTSEDLARGSVEIPSYKAFILDSMVPDVQKDLSFSTYIDNFHAVDPSVYEPPASVAPILRPYQKAGFQWLSALCDMGFGGILADEMGLGKSLQMISLLLARREEGPALIVCPASLVYNWRSEIKKFAPSLNVALVAGGAEERAELRQENWYDVYITSYELLRRDIEDYSKMDFWCEVLDEAQYIKNRDTLIARTVKLVPARNRFALTGTPIENRVSELWSIFDYLMPGFLASYDRFRERYEQPILDGDESAARLLSETVAPFVLRRRKDEVLTDLPDKLEQVVYAELDGEQRKLYHAHEQALRVALSKSRDNVFGKDRMEILAELMRLRQICCDPALVYEDYEGGSAKLDAIMDLVSASVDAQQKMLVFSQFTSYLDVIARKLDESRVSYYVLTGATPKKRRIKLVNAFNKDDTPVFLISLKAGGTGLNLTGANVVVHADPWWNAAAQNQATDRAHRIGQTKDVTVYKVIARDTIEDRILALQEAKSDLAEQVVGEGGGSSLGSLRKEDLIELLGD